MPAGSSALATVPHFRVIFALPSAIITSGFAKVTKLFGEFAVKAHDLGGGIAQRSAFEIELDAAYHAIYRAQPKKLPYILFAG